MKVHLNVDRAGLGSARVTPESLDDMYSLFSMIAVNDRVRASTVRKVVHESTSGGASTSERVRTQLTVRVIDVLFDPELGEVRVSGVNCTEHEHVRAGAHHALELEVHRPLEIFKDKWEAIELEALRALQGSEAANDADLFAVMLDVGTAQVCAILPSMTLVRARVDVAVPKKRGGTERHEAAIARFFTTLSEAVIRSVNWETARSIIFASPGFVKDDFLLFFFNIASSRGLKAVLEARSRIICAHASSGHKGALAATLANPAVAARLSNVRALGEGNLMSRFNELLAKDSERAQYGWRHVRAALDAGAVEHLLVNDTALRARDPRARTAVIRLLDDARAAGVSVSVISSFHVSGEILHGLGNFAALLRYAVYGIEEAARLVVPLGESPVESTLADGITLAPGHRVQVLAAAPQKKSRDLITPEGEGDSSEAYARASGGFDTESDESEDSDC